jgi:hypothetical protein
MGIYRNLEDVRRDLTLLAEQGKVEGFFNNVQNVDKLDGMVEDIRDAMMEYQVCVYGLSVSGTSDVCDRPRYSKISTTRVAGSS